MSKTCLVQLVLKAALIFAGFFAFPGNLLAQYAQDWRFGYSARIQFSSNPPQGAPNSQLFSDDGCVSITGATGQTLFYSSGEAVYNRNNVVMTNGNNLRGSQAATQSVLTIPFPGQANQHLLFTLGRGGDTLGLHYNLIDMSLSGGFGAVVTGQKNISLLPGAPTNFLTEKMAATRHCNNQDFWVVTHRYNSNEFIVYPVTSSGVGAPSFQQVGTAHTPAIATNPQRAQRGYMVFSPDGRKLALTLNGPNANNLVEVFDFDKSTGTISNPLRLPAVGGEYGLAFSPDNGKLFVAGGTDTTIGPNIGSKNILRAFNMVAPNPAATGEVVQQQILSDSRRFAALQNAPDGRIYVVLTLTDALNSINTPNTPPYQFADSTVFPINGTTRRGLPNFVNDEFSLPFNANFSFEFTCIGQPMDFFDSTLANARSWSWTFGDPTSTNDTSTQRFPSWTYNAPGNYNVTLIAGDGCGRLDTITKTVEVGLNLPVSFGSDTLYACLGDTVTLLSNITSGSFDWYTGQPGGPWTLLPNDTLAAYQTTSSGWFRLEADNGNCAGTDSVYVFVNNNPITVDLGDDFALCIGSIEVLDAGNPGATSYLWSTGDQTRTISITSPDTFWVTVTDRGCVATDTIIVSLDSTTSISVMPDTSTCPGDPITLSAAGFGISYVWNTGETAASISVEDTGSYIVQVTTTNGCILYDTIQVAYKCDTRVYFPSAFTPNGDKLNDVFMPALRSADLGEYELSIYDRWGQLVFITNRVTVGWDGKINGVEAQQGAYQYVCRFYTNVQRVNTFETGTFFLIR